MFLLNYNFVILFFRNVEKVWKLGNYVERKKIHKNLEYEGGLTYGVKSFPSTPTDRIRPSLPHHNPTT